MTVSVLKYAQMVITEMIMQHVNHVQDIVLHVPDQLNTNVLNVIVDSMLNMTISMNVKHLVILDITPTKKQRHVMIVMILVLVVKQLEQIHVLAVMEI